MLMQYQPTTKLIYLMCFRVGFSFSFRAGNITGDWYRFQKLITSIKFLLFMIVYLFSKGNGTLSKIEPFNHQGKVSLSISWFQRWRKPPSDDVFWWRNVILEYIYEQTPFTIKLQRSYCEGIAGTWLNIDRHPNPWILPNMTCTTW